ncbi:MAG TPA: alkaline shock response membrane anchor protein AmaP, partial [Pseudonocardiaceae bacterium]
MSDPNRPARLNRGLLVLIALVLIATGTFTLATGLGVLNVLHPAAALVPTGAPAPPWVPYAATALAILLGLLCLRWLTAQAMRRPKTGTWRWARDPDRGVTQ